MRSPLPATPFLEASLEGAIHIYEARLRLHGVFWFHTYAQPREKYTHISLPIIHNYPLLLAFLGKPVDSSYASVAGMTTFTTRPEEVWGDKGFYVYPAIAVRMMARTLTFSLGGTGYVGFKPRTRASVPDFTAHQVFLPGTEFKTYIIARDEESVPGTKIIRLGAKRYGVFRVELKRLGSVEAEDNTQLLPASHPFNTRDCPAKNYYSILRHYAGAVALGGIPVKTIRVREAVLAAPHFLGG